MKDLKVRIVPVCREMSTFKAMNCKYLGASYVFKASKALCQGH